jgi:acetyltransferase-like isoleucine patch superfamily enzyme
MSRKVKRLVFYCLKFFIGQLVYLDARVYMKYYNRLLRWNGFKINGTPRFIAKSAKFDDFEMITLGDRLVVSSNVIFLTHDYSYTTALIAIDEIPSSDIGLLGAIEIGSNVFIGMNSILLPGTTIGSNVIIGAGSVVRGNVGDNVIVSGNPAQIVADISQHAIKLKQKKYERRVDKK